MASSFQGETCVYFELRKSSQKGQSCQYQSYIIFLQKFCTKEEDKGGEWRQERTCQGEGHWHYWHYQNSTARAFFSNTKVPHPP